MNEDEPSTVSQPSTVLCLMQSQKNKYHQISSILSSATSTLRFSPKMCQGGLHEQCVGDLSESDVVVVWGMNIWGQLLRKDQRHNVYPLLSFLDVYKCIQMYIDIFWHKHFKQEMKSYTYYWIIEIFVKLRFEARWALLGFPNQPAEWKNSCHLSKDAQKASGPESDQYQCEIYLLLGNKSINYMGVSENRGTPKSSIFNRIFHYKPSILGYPCFWKHPYSI